MNIRRRSCVEWLALGLLCTTVSGLGACKRDAKKAEPVAAAPAPTHAYNVGDKAHCPVTNEDFVVSASTVQLQHDGHYYAFCCADCSPTFEKHPEKYARP